MTVKASDKTPAILIPAPAIMFLLIALGSLLNRWLPAVVERPQALWTIGWAHNWAGLLLIAWSFAVFHRHRTAIMPHQGANAFVVSGPYRVSRNPMYLGLALIHIGITIASGNLWHAASFFPSLLLIRYYVIAREEAHLAAKFGDAYRDYCARVPRWI